MLFFCIFLIILDVGLTYSPPRRHVDFKNSSAILERIKVELLPFKSRFILKTVHNNCSAVVAPHVDKCSDDYDRETTNRLLEDDDPEDERKILCCNLLVYHRCFNRAIQQSANKSCSDEDISNTEMILRSTENLALHKKFCPSFKELQDMCFIPSRAFLLHLNFYTYVVLIFVLLVFSIFLLRYSFTFQIFSYLILFSYSLIIAATRTSAAIEMFERNNLKPGQEDMILLIQQPKNI